MLNDPIPACKVHPRSGLNDILWVAYSGLPVVHQTLMSLLRGYFQYDVLDMEEIFLDFPLHASLQPYTGVDVGHGMGKGKGQGAEKMGTKKDKGIGKVGPELHETDGFTLPFIAASH